MFTLDVDMPELSVAMFAQGTAVVADIDIWHKRIGHVNVQRLKSMQAQNIVAAFALNAFGANIHGMALTATTKVLDKSLSDKCSCHT